MREMRRTFIEFRGVSFCAVDAHLLLWDLSLSVHPGETQVLLGRAGSGITTTHKLISHRPEPSNA